MERSNTEIIGDINDFAFLKPTTAAAKSEDAPMQPAESKAKPSVKPHIPHNYDWYQNATHVFLTFKVVGDKDLAKRTKVELSEKEVKLSYEDGEIVVPLSMAIDTSLSTHHPFSHKIELKLLKATPNENWLSLEPKGGLVQTAKPVTVVPTEQKAKPYASNKNWDAIDKELKD